MRWMRGAGIVVVCVICFSSQAQLESYNQERLKTDRGLMLTLGSWATANLSTGAIGWATTPKGEAHYFHQMNFFWNTVNLALAIPGYISARKEATSHTFAETMRAQRKTETIFLINSGLDIGYMSAGLLLRSEAKSNPAKAAQWRGYGNSLLLQGGFLFLFDMTAYLIHKRHYKRKLNPKLDQLELSDNGFGIQWNIAPNSIANTNKTFL